MGRSKNWLLAAAVVVAACTRHEPSSPAPPRAATPAPPSRAEIQAGPHSPLADVRLPAGATFAGNSSNEERWRYTTPYDDAIAFLRMQFATGRKYDANGATSWRDLPPCYNDKHERPPGGWVTDDATFWLWTDGSNSLSVQVYRPTSKATPNEIVIDYRRWDHAYPCYRD